MLTPARLRTLALVGLAFGASGLMQEKPSPGSNRLAAETSPYLLLHAGNPVDWYPWGEEAIERARKEAKPIFLSVGYSTCYWCHVMEREVFSNPSIAALMNEWFINIKVDREEQPDLDEIYMTATQLLTQSGGWPNSVFLTPGLEPFYAGTYFPPEDRGARIGFPTLLRRVHQLWSSRREEILQQGRRVGEALREVLASRGTAAGEVPSAEIAGQAVAEVKKSFDSENGGFGGAPKFPSPANLFLLWEQADSGDGEARRMVLETLLHMGRGAIYDQLGGGFHRYTLDEKWRVPHFEKMLYDNAHLAEILAVAAAARPGEAVDLARLARGTLDFALREMTLPGGAFKSALDAETEGEEGAYYVWTAEELVRALGEEGFARAAPVLGFEGPPNLEGGKYTLWLNRPPVGPDVAPHLERLRQARGKRPFPRIDDKVLTDWNGMMIAAMARAGRLLGEPRYVAAAVKAADFLLENLRSADGALLHAWRLGKAKIPAFLDDYAFFVRGLLALEEGTGEARWLRQAERLTGEVEARLGDAAGGYFQSERRPDLLVQLKTVTDGAIPSANGIMILNLLKLGERTGKANYRQRAADALRVLAPELARYPGNTQTLTLAVLRYHRSPAGPRPTAPAETDTGRAKSLAGLARSLVTAEARLQEPALGDGWRPFVLTLTVSPGWHINAHPASDAFLVPTTVVGPARNVRYPEGERVRFAFADRELAVYQGQVSIAGEVSGEVESLRLTYQACDDTRCLPAVETLVPLPKP